jgi:hypothetical protein
MNEVTLSVLATIALFFGMLALGEFGRRLALGRPVAGDSRDTGFAVLDGAVFGLLGLIVAFSFAGAIGRFDERRALIIEETITIGSTYQFLDLLPNQPRAELQVLFRNYLDSRIAFYNALQDIEAAAGELDNTREIETSIWSSAVTAADGNQPAQMLLLSSINDMFDIATKRTLNMLLHPPPVIFVLMFALALISALLAGYGSAKSGSRDWIRLLGFATVASVAFYVILDIEFPRSGLIQIDKFDLALVRLRTGLE